MLNIYIFSQWFTVNIDEELDYFKIQEEEVEQIKWFSKEEVIKTLKENPNFFTPGARMWIKCLLNKYMITIKTKEEIKEIEELKFMVKQAQAQDPTMTPSQYVTNILMGYLKNRVLNIYKAHTASQTYRNIKRKIWSTFRSKELIKWQLIFQHH